MAKKRLSCQKFQTFLHPEKTLYSRGFFKKSANLA